MKSRFRGNLCGAVETNRNRWVYQRNNTKWYQKAGAPLCILSNFIPDGGVVTKAAKVTIKGR